MPQTIEPKPLSPEELMPGNLIYFPGTTREAIAKSLSAGIYHSSIHAASKVGSGTFDKAYAVPLTSELMQRAGFERQGGYWHHSGPDVVIVLEKNDKPQTHKLPNGFYYLIGTHFKPIAATHELQQFFLLFTGKTLAIEPL